MAGNVFRWLAGGEFNAPKAESVDTTVSPPRTAPRPRIKKTVKKKDTGFAAEVLVDPETVKTPYGLVDALPGQYIVYFDGQAQVLTPEEYATNFEEVK